MLSLQIDRTQVDLNRCCLNRFQGATRSIAAPVDYYWCAALASAVATAGAWSSGRKWRAGSSTGGVHRQRVLSRAGAVIAEHAVALPPYHLRWVWPRTEALVEEVLFGSGPLESAHDLQERLATVAGLHQRHIGIDLDVRNGGVVGDSDKTQDPPEGRWRSDISHASPTPWMAKDASTTAA
jgi:hypothetical protein